MNIESYLKQNSDFSNHIIIDQVTTWPESIYNLIDSSKNELSKYISEKKRIENIRNRASRPRNEYEDKWISVVNLINFYLDKNKIVGFHCSRLMNDEVEDILTNGLTPLNSDFANKRIKRVYEKGLIPIDLMNSLLNKEELSEENRKGAIHFTHNTSVLRYEQGLFKFFKLWGGEAIYSGFEENKYLQKIGTPCIIVASIEYQDLINLYLSERMICIYLGDSYYYSHEVDSCINKKVNVLAIIMRNNKLFNSLTNIDDWVEKIN
jgi:hypothetical protein